MKHGVVASRADAIHAEHVWDWHSPLLDSLCLLAPPRKQPYYAIGTVSGDFLGIIQLSFVEYVVFCLVT